MKVKAVAVAVILSGLTLGGCAQYAPLAPIERGVTELQGAPVCCEGYAQMPVTRLASQNKTVAVSLTSDAAAYDFADGKSYFQAFQLPTQLSRLELTTRSYFDRGVLLPELQLLDSQLNVIKTIRADQFAVTYSSVGRRISLNHTLLIDRSQPGVQPAYLIVKADPRSQQGETQVMSAARKWAKETGLAEPVEADPVFPHTMTGEVELDIAVSGYQLVAGKVSSLGDVSQPVKVMSPTPAVATVAAPAVTLGGQASKPRSDATQSVVPMLSETDAFYQSQIEKAVTAGDINKAMTLVNEAERAGSTKAKTVFVEAVKRSQK